MTTIFLTQYGGKIIGPIAKLLGYIMQGIYTVLDKLHIGNIGLAIILFTIFIYLLLMPLTIKQQKFSKLSAKMNPELQAVQAKYKGKQDQASMMAMQDETKAIYAKYGVSPSGSCLQLLIQMPILFALYRVIYAIPAYVPLVKAKFNGAVEAVLSSGQKGIDALSELSSAKYFNPQLTNAQFTEFINGTGGSEEYVRNTIVDVLNRASTSDWTKLAETLDGHSAVINETAHTVEKLNSFGVLNIANAPWDTMKSAFASGAFFVVLCALLIPVLSAVTQYVNAKLMPNAADDNTNAQDNPMAASMKSMTTIMPLMSAFISFTLPIGLGIYWIAGAVVRTIQQIVINKHIDKMDIDDLITKNTEKYNEKIAKKGGTTSQRLSNYANMSTKNMSVEAAKATRPQRTQEEKDAAMKKATQYYGKNAAKPGSITAKANMVKQYDEKKK